MQGPQNPRKQLKINHLNPLDHKYSRIFTNMLLDAKGSPSIISVLTSTAAHYFSYIHFFLSKRKSQTILSNSILHRFM